MEINALSVSEIVFSIKKTLEQQYLDNTVVGEISNLSLSSAGHYYFNLSDENCSISCALFKMDAFRNPAIRKMKNGDKVLLRGPVSLYTKRGTFQIICKRIIPYGKGDLKAQFEFLKEKLRAEGLFDQDQKVTIPLLPKKIAVITALRGAALQDFLNVMKRRSLWFDINIIPSIVQGDSCAKSVIKCIERVEEAGSFDVIVITRGGGSMEDLWGFNDENLVRKVFNTKIPIISAIGHQVDYTLIDFVSDMRCETPSSAAEILSQEQTHLASRLNSCVKEIKSLFSTFKYSLSKRLEGVNPIQVLHLIQQQFRQAEIKLDRLRFYERGDLLRVNENQQYVDELINRFQKIIEDQLSNHNNKIILMDKLLSSLNPKNVLGRGFTYLETNSGNVITSMVEFDSISSKELIDIHFSDGKGRVKKV